MFKMFVFKFCFCFEFWTSRLLIVKVGDLKTDIKRIIQFIWTLQNSQKNEKKKTK